MRLNAIIRGIVILAIVLILLYLCLYNLTGLIKIISIIIAGLIVLLVLLDILLFPIIRYNRYKYLVTADKIEVKKGLFLITRSIIQIKRVQKVEISDGPIDRKFALANVNIFTAAGVVDIKFLNKIEAESITEEINDLLKEKIDEADEN